MKLPTIKWLDFVIEEISGRKGEWKLLDKGRIPMNEYKFASELLNGIIVNEIHGANTRDFIFHDCLNKFNNQPINIFQIGAIETFDVRWRIGSGWSDIIFGQYISKNGGKLTIVDININNLAHSSYAATKLNYEVDLVYGDAINHINDEYNIYYLDGSNDPQETLDQYLKIKDVKSIVIVDDFKIKGTLLKKYLEENNIAYSFYDVANEVITIDQLEEK